MTTVVGFIGLGAMGRPMATHLLAAGYTVRAYARRAEARRPLVEAGAVDCATPAEAARGAEVVCVNVTATADVEQVLFGPGGVVEGAAAGTVVIDFSTISALATRAFAARLGERGIELLDCPVSGGEAGARAATLTIMAGGRAEVLARVQPLLLKLGRTVTWVGDHGAGQIAKACNQVVQVVNIQGIAEAMLLAQAFGVAPERLLAAIAPGFAGSRMLELMGPKMAARDFVAGIPSRLHRKDFGLVLEVAREAQLGLPAAALVAQQLNALAALGGGDDDTSALLKVVEAMNGRLPPPAAGAAASPVGGAAPAAVPVAPLPQTAAPPAGAGGAQKRKPSLAP